MKRHFSLWFCLFVLVGMTAGCKPPSPAATPSVPRLVASYSPAMEVVFALRLHPYLVGIPQSTKNIPVYRALRPDIDSLPSVGSKMNGIHLETVLNLKPSLVLMFAGVDGVRSMQKLEQFGIPCEVVEMESVTDIQKSLHSVAVRLHKEDIARRITTEMERVLQLVAERVAQKTERLAQKTSATKMSIYFASNRSLMTTHSQQMLQHEMIERAGGSDVVDVKIGGWVAVSAEQLMQWNPRIIVISGQSSYSLKSVMEDIRFKELDAIKTAQVYRMPDAVMPWDFPGPDVALGILWLARLCSPDLFHDIDIEAQKERFYQVVYGVSFNDLSTSNKKDK